MLGKEKQDLLAVMKRMAEVGKVAADLRLVHCQRSGGLDAEDD
jgi:hypothetical protein